MEPVTDEVFMTWAAGVGIGFDPRYPNARDLRLLPPRTHRRFWELPESPGTWPYFVDSVIQGLEPWSSGYLWVKPGKWPTVAEKPMLNDQVRDLILKGAGVPDEWNGALRFQRSESPTLIGVLFAFMAFG